VIVRKSAALLVALWLAAMPVAASAEGQSMEAGYGAASALCSLVYGPVKIAYAGLGSLVSGFAWVLSGGDNDVAGPILTASLRGDYVVTPSHLRGERDIVFVGRNPAQEMAVSSGYDEGF
jgi:hypothetical protein